MAIFSLHHSFIGRKGSPPGSASLFARYALRAEVCTESIGHRMPTRQKVLMAWLDDQEQNDRKNARVIDKLVVALPVELTHEENCALLDAFGERMTEGKAMWMAAIHDGERDADNPHAHIIFRDRHFLLDKRVMMTTEKGSTERFREAWEEEVNRALDRKGLAQRVDRRSLEEQGIDREAQLHVGASAEKLRDKQHEFRSAQKEITRIVDGVPETVTVNYPAIDEGKTRFEENEERKMRNTLRERAMDGIAADEAELQALYYRAMQGEATEERDRDRDARRVRLAGEDGRNDRIISFEAETQALYHKALQDDVPPVDYLPWLVSLHIAERDAARTNEVEFQDREEPNIHSSHDDPSGRSARRGPTDLIGGGGLAIVARVAESLESILDGPARLSPAKEEQHSMPDKEQVQQTRRELDERKSADDYAKWRKVELDAYLEQRRKERGMERGR